MKTLSTVLINNIAVAVGQGYTIPINGGRFIITSEYDIIDTVSGIKYLRDVDIPLDVATMEITDLTTEPTNIAYLWALAVKPIIGLTDAQMQGKVDFLPIFVEGALDKEILDPEDFIWVAADGGVFIEPTKALIPGFGAYYAVPTTGLIHFVDETVVIAGTNRGNTLILVDDLGEDTEVETEHLILLAAGRLSRENIPATIYHIDNNSTNTTLANVALIPQVDATATATIGDATDDFVLGNE